LIFETLQPYHGNEFLGFFSAFFCRDPPHFQAESYIVHYVKMGHEAETLKYHRYFCSPELVELAFSKSFNVFTVENDLSGCGLLQHIDTSDHG
jgi:hypothetical protein